MVLIWADQDRSGVKVIPRYSNWLTWCTVLPLIPSGQAGIVGSPFLEKVNDSIRGGSGQESWPQPILIWR